MLNKATWMGVRYAATGNTFADTTYRMLLAQVDKLHAAIPDRDVTCDDLLAAVLLAHEGQLRDDLAIYVDGLRDVEPAHDSIVRGLIGRELAAQAAQQLLTSQNSGDLDLDRPSDLLERARDCVTGGLASPVITLDQLSMPSANDERGEVIPLGISKQLDRELGGAGAGELICFLAPPRRGKTTIMRMVGAHMVKEGYNVLDITLETATAKIGRLYERAILHKPRRGFADADSIEARRILANRGGKLWLKDMSHMDVTPDSVEGMVRAIQRDTGERVDAIILDYLELMTPARGKLGDQMMRFMYGRLGKQMRAVGRKFGIPIITAWQVNREGSQKDTITEADISECWDLFKHVDMMIALNRTEQEKANRRMRLGILKQREDDEASAQIDVYCDYSTMTIRDLTKEDNAIHQTGSAPRTADAGIRPVYGGPGFSSESAGISRRPGIHDLGINQMVSNGESS